MNPQIQALLASLGPNEKLSISHNHIDGLDTSIDEYQVVFQYDQGSVFCALSTAKKAYPWAGLAQINFTKVFIECPAGIDVSITSKKKIFSKQTTPLIQSQNTKIKQLILNNQTILISLSKEPDLVIETTNKLNIQSFDYPSEKFLLAKVKTIVDQERFSNLISLFKELLFILNKFK